MTVSAKAAARDNRLCVLKFGSSVLRNPEDYAKAAHEIYRHTRAGEKVIAVVSALEGETDALFAVGDAVGQGMADNLVARLVRTGELKSAALLGLALERSGIPAAVLDPHEMDLIAEGDALDANLVSLDAHRVLKHLENADVIIAPGFYGESENGPATLGRGGTDLTAIMFAHWLGASRARLLKDVDGVYSADPRDVPDAERLDQLDYIEAAKVSRGLVQEKAIFAARDLGVIIEVAAIGRGYATRIGPDNRLPGRTRILSPLRVAILGHGSVGAGLCTYLLGQPEQFVLNPVLVRNPSAHTQPDLSFTDQAEIALDDEPDIVVEAMGGTGLARSLTQSALRDGAHLVTANKAVIAQDIELLKDLARSADRQLRYSASVGGGVPILETLDRLTPHTGVLAVEGVMNGTCNFIFSRLKQGASLDDAIIEAQQAGFAEADPSTDLDGHDAADKLSIISRHAFGIGIDPASIPKDKLTDLSKARIKAVNQQGLLFKQIGSCAVTRDGRIEAKVEIRAIQPNHPFARLENEQNGFLIRTPQGEVEIRGKGAGRWPTAEAVFADIMDIQRHITANDPQTTPPHPVHAPSRPGIAPV